MLGIINAKFPNGFTSDFKMKFPGSRFQEESVVLKIITGAPRVRRAEWAAPQDAHTEVLNVEKGKEFVI